MKIIYVYKRDPYAAKIAAYAYLRLNALSKSKDINNKYKKEGHFYYLGIDEDLNEVYLLHSTKKGPMLQNLLNGLAYIYSEEIKIVNLENK